MRSSSARSAISRRSTTTSIFALLDLYADKSPQIRRRYATTLLAMLKRAKAERVIKSHQLSDIILPPAPRNGDLQPRTRNGLGVIMGPALLEYEVDQTA